MFKLHRAVAVISSVIALGTTAAMAGCSTAEDDDAGATDQAVEEGAAPLARFSQYIRSLKTPLASGKPVEDIAQTLLNSGRPASFSLQALCRLYEKADPKFATMRDDFKGLEDGIGAYDKWDSIYRKAVSEGKDQETLARLKKQADDALTRFKSLLTSKNWIKDGGAGSPHLEEIETFLNTYKWKSRKEDRGIVLDHLIKEMKDLNETQYDMKILEVGDGIHELRRDLRWILIEQLALNGMTVTKKECPAAGYSNLGEDGRYTSLRSSALEPNPCQLSLCLVSAASKAVNDLGDVKDEAEEEVNINGDADVVPAHLQPQAAALYDAIKKNDLFGNYLTQLNACKSSL